MQYKSLKFLALVFLGLAASCGGTAPNMTFTGGLFDAPSSFANQCQTPRTGVDPATGSAFLDKAGSTALENFWLRSWTNYYYLWYSEVIDADPNSYSTPDYFNLMKTTQTTATGHPKDRFHFTYPSDQWYALSQLGQSFGYGATWAVIASKPPRNIVVAYTDPSTPATTAPASLLRGAQVVAIDGVDAINAPDQTSVNILNAGLFPKTSGETHSFTVKDLGSLTTRTFSMTSANITATPVQNVKTVGSVGYMVFNDHSAPSEAELIAAFQTLQTAHVTDLVLDLRYNGGGYLDIASEVAFMIAGAAQASGKFFENVTFNNKYPTTNPITGETLVPIPFHTTALGFSATAGQALPQLSLSRVFVITTAGTCSASESIINALRGVDVTVVLVGSTTCGKPYGFYPEDNCGTTYFSIQFQDVNNKLFGDYADGFAPTCTISDDYTHQLGDTGEGMFAAALYYQAHGSCPVMFHATSVQNEAVVVKPEPMMNAIMRR